VPLKIPAGWKGDLSQSLYSGFPGNEIFQIIGLKVGQVFKPVFVKPFFSQWDNKNGRCLKVLKKESVWFIRQDVPAFFSSGSGKQDPMFGEQCI